MGGKGGFAELANWVIPPPGHGSLLGAPPGPAHNSHHAGGGFGGGGFSNGAGAFNSAYMGGTHGGGGGHTSGGLGHYGPTNERFHRGHGERGGRGGGSGRGSTVCRKCTLAGSTSTNHSDTMCPLNECFKCGKSGHIRQFCPN